VCTTHYLHSHRSCNKKWSVNSRRNFSYIFVMFLWREMKGIVVLEPQSPGLEKEASVNKNSCFFPLFESLEVLCCNKCDKISHIERLKSQLKNCRYKTHKKYKKSCLLPSACAISLSSGETEILAVASKNCIIWQWGSKIPVKWKLCDWYRH